MLQIFNSQNDIYEAWTLVHRRWSSVVNNLKIADYF